MVLAGLLSGIFVKAFRLKYEEDNWVSEVAWSARED